MENPSLQIGDNNWAVKDGSILGYNIIQDNYLPQPIDFTRASTATRVNAEGLIEGVRTNLALYSEQFDNAVWAGTVGVTKLANQAIAPNGTNTMDLITFPLSNSSIGQGINVVSGQPYTFSVWLSTQSGTVDAEIGNVNIGVFQSVTVTTTPTRFTITQNASSATRYPSIRAINPCSLLVWGAQLELSPSATEYIPTTTTAVSVGMLANVPRIDYTTGSPALLLEPQRTNYITYSNYNASIWTQTTASISINSATSPDGTTNAHTATRTSVSTQRIGVAAFSATAGQPYTNSIYLRKVSGSGLVRLIDINNTPTTFTLTTEWVRYSVTAIAVASTQRLYVEMTEVGDVIEFWQGQIENGSYSTSLINTTSTAVTRVKDSASKSGISSLIGQTEGTLFVEFNIDGDISGNRTVITLSSGSSVDFIASFIFNNLFYARIRANNGSLIDVTKSGLTSGVHKVAIGYAANDLTFYLDGVLVGQNTSASVAFANPLSVVRIAENEAAINQLGDGINSAMLFTTRLDNATLATLTTI